MRRLLVELLGGYWERGEVTSVPTPHLRDALAQLRSTRTALQLVDGLLSQKEYAAAQSQVRIAYLAIKTERAP